MASICVDVEVADRDQGGALGPVIGVVEGGEARALGVRDHLGNADRDALRQALAAQQIAELVDEDAVAGRRAGALLGLDDAALAVDRGRREGHFARHFAQQEQGLVDLRGVALGQVELVDGLP